jgi:hypothetical protein
MCEVPEDNGSAPAILQDNATGVRVKTPKHIYFSVTLPVGFLL